MQLITLHSQVNSDGLLQLQLPGEFKDRNVIVTIQPEAPEWLSVLQKTAGTIPDLESPPKGSMRCANLYNVSSRYQCLHPLLEIY